MNLASDISSIWPTKARRGVFGFNSISREGEQPQATEKGEQPRREAQEINFPGVGATHHGGSLKPRSLAFWSQMMESSQSFLNFSLAAIAANRFSTAFCVCSAFRIGLTNLAPSPQYSLDCLHVAPAFGPRARAPDYLPVNLLFPAHRDKPALHVRRGRMFPAFCWRSVRFVGILARGSAFCRPFC